MLIFKKSLSHKGRSTWKGFFKQKYNSKEIGFNNRISVVREKMLNKTVLVSNGKKDIPLKLTRKFLGLRLGQGVITKKMGMAIHYKPAKSSKKGKGKKKK